MMNERIQPLAIQKYVSLSQRKDIISFAAGLPDLSVLPLEQLKAAYSQINEEPSSSFQYQGPRESLKKKIQGMMAERSVHCNLDEILITGGAQQGIYLTANLFFQQQAPLMIEEFVYPGFLQIANLFELEYLTIPAVNNQGLDLNYLETILKAGKVLPYLYMVCNGHNPQGNTLATQTRKELAFLAEKYNFIIVEDDPYGYLNFSDEEFLPIRAYTRNAIYIGSFSKIIAPALRVGWVVGEPEIIQKLQQLKDMNDLYSLNPNQLALNRLLESHSLAEITAPQKDLYKNKLACMTSALQENLKVPFQYVTPQHGMFLWLELPHTNIESNHDYLFEESKVLYIPASAFAVNNLSSRQAVRLSFTYPSCDEIDLGIKAFSKVINTL